MGIFDIKTKGDKEKKLQAECDVANNLCEDFIGKFILLDSKVLIFNGFVIDKGLVGVAYKKTDTAEGILNVSRWDTNTIIKARERFIYIKNELLSYGYEIIKIKEV